jgi:hypothetical protein
MGIKYIFNPTTGSLDAVSVETPAGADTEIQFNNAGVFGADSDLTWDDTSTPKVLGVGGDINLDDGGTYTTTLQVITPTAARTISFPDATGTVGLVGGSSGNLVVNQSGAYAGVANSSVDNATGDITLGSRFISSLNGAASAPPGTFTGTWFTGGTATTTKPQVLIEPTGTTSTAWSTSGTGLGVNAASGFAGALLDLQINGTSRFHVKDTNLTTVTIEGSGLSSPGLYFRNGTAAGTIKANAVGLNFDNNANTYLAHLNTTGYFVSSTSVIGFSDSTAGLGTPDVRLARDAADILALRRTTNAQTSRVYGTYTDASNYVRAALSSTSTAVTLAAETAGTGADDIPLNLTAAGTGTVKVNSNLEIADTKDIVLDTGTGTKIGTATTQKLGFWDKTPVVQPTTGISGATFVADSGGSIHPSSTFDGYTIAQVVAALRQLGILA